MKGQFIKRLLEVIDPEEFKRGIEESGVSESEDVLKMLVDICNGIDPGYRHIRNNVSFSEDFPNLLSEKEE